MNIAHDDGRGAKRFYWRVSIGYYSDIGEQFPMTSISVSIPDGTPYLEAYETMLGHITAELARYGVGEVLWIGGDQAMTDLTHPLSEARSPHETREVWVLADVDLGIAAMVEYLQTIPGVRTDASCQGTIGEGGPNPYRAQVMAHWPASQASRLRDEFDVTLLGDNWGYLHPRDGWKVPGAAFRFPESDWVLVPRTPTKAMIEAAWASALGEDAVGVWEAMLDEALALPTRRALSDGDATGSEPLTDGPLPSGEGNGSSRELSPSGGSALEGKK